MNAEAKPKEPSNGLISLPAVKSMADRYELTPAAFAFTFRAVAMPAAHSEAEFLSCLLVAHQHGLNPLTKEIYFMKTRSGAIQAIVSVDGWMRKCNENPAFDGMEFGDQHDDKGALVSTTCTIYRKDRSHPIKVTEYLDECLKVGGPVWKTNPRRMLRHRALTQCARYAFGFAGVMDREEFEEWQRTDRMVDVTPKASLVDDIPDIPETPEPVPFNPEATPDPLAEFEGDAESCGDMETLNEVWARFEVIFEDQPEAVMQRAIAIYNQHKKRVS